MIRETKTQWLIRLAKRRGMTQGEISAITSVSQPTISKILSGDGCARKAAGVIDCRLSDYLQMVQFNGEWFCLRGAVS